MDLGPSSAAAMGAPMPVADMRPSADAAALSKAREPEIAFASPPVQPPNASQAATISRSLLLATGVETTDKSRAVQGNDAAERKLKPYGISMLPDGAASDRNRQSAQGEPDAAPGQASRAT